MYSREALQSYVFCDRLQKKVALSENDYPVMALRRS